MEEFKPEAIAKSILLENAFENNLTTNVGEIIYKRETDIEKGGKSILNRTICDNVVFCHLFKSNECISDNHNMPLKNHNFKIKESYLKKIQFDLRNIFCSEKGYLKNLVISTHRPLIFSEEFYDQTREEDVRRIKLYIANKKILFPIEAFVKVTFDNYSIEKVFNDIQSYRSKLEDLGFFLHDIDVSEDVTGIFERNEFYDYLIHEHHFIKYQPELELNEANKYDQWTIVDQTRLSGINCIVIIYGNLRIKIYNKFVCQITSPGTDTGLGSLIVSYISPKDIHRYLKELFTHPDFVQKGCTRLEITFYKLHLRKTLGNMIYNLNDVVYIDIFKPNALRDTFNMIRDKIVCSGPLYNVSTSLMWTRLTETLESNCCIYFEEEGFVFISMWVNKITRKITGHKINLSRYNPEQKEDAIKSIISNFSLNLIPFYFITIPNIKSINVYDLKTFLKEGYTYLTRKSNLFSMITDVELVDRGIVENNILKPNIFKKETRISSTYHLQPFFETKAIVDKVMFSKNQTRSLLKKNQEDKKKLGNPSDSHVRQIQYRQLVSKHKEYNLALGELEDRLGRNFNAVSFEGLSTSTSYQILAFSISNHVKPKIFYYAKDLSSEENFISEATDDLKKVLYTRYLERDQEGENLKESNLRNYSIYFKFGYNDQLDSYSIIPLYDFALLKILPQSIIFQHITLLDDIPIELVKFEKLIDEDIVATRKNSISVNNLNPNDVYTVLKVKPYSFRGTKNHFIIFKETKEIYYSNIYFDSQFQKHNPLVSFTLKTFEEKRFTRQHKNKDLEIVFEI